MLGIAEVPNLPLMAACCSNWPNFLSFGKGGCQEGSQARYRNHDRFDITPVSPLWYVWPVQIEWLERIQTSSAWNSFKLIKSDRLFPPRIIGRCFKKSSNDPMQMVHFLDELVIGPDYWDWISKNAQNVPSWPLSSISGI
jgi:hypothetical protein